MCRVQAGVARGAQLRAAGRAAASRAGAPPPAPSALRRHLPHHQRLRARLQVHTPRTHTHTHTNSQTVQPALTLYFFLNTLD